MSTNLVSIFEFPVEKWPLIPKLVEQSQSLKFDYQEELVKNSHTFINPAYTVIDLDRTVFAFRENSHQLLSTYLETGTWPDANEDVSIGHVLMNFRFYPTGIGICKSFGWRGFFNLLETRIKISNYLEEVANFLGVREMIHAMDGMDEYFYSLNEKKAELSQVNKSDYFNSIKLNEFKELIHSNGYERLDYTFDYYKKYYEQVDDEYKTASGPYFKYCDRGYFLDSYPFTH